jgi:hypothetical protein
LKYARAADVNVEALMDDELDLPKRVQYGKGQDHEAGFYEEWPAKGEIRLGVTLL